jgi:DNA-binding transcriptional LysR family regulator
MYPTAQLHAFLEVAAQGSFTRAAQRLGIAQPTASQLVRSLEERVGTPLLVRDRRGVRPTAAGAALLPHAERALALAAEAAGAVDDAVAGERVRLAVGAGEAYATYRLPQAVARLRTRLPRLEARFVVGDEARILSALRLREVDAVLVTDRSVPGDVEAVAYARGRTVLIAAGGEPAPPRPLTLRDLEGRVLVERDPGTVNRREVDALIERSGVHLGGRLVAASLEAVKRSVEAGLGVAIVPSIAVERELELGVLTELSMRRPVLEYGVCLGWRRGEEPTAAVAGLLDELRRGPADGGE